MGEGLIQVYCGEGKGKTTAAVGLGIRAIGQGLKVIMIQFLKSRPTGEEITLKNLEPDFKLFRFEKQNKFYCELNEDEKREQEKDIKNGLNFAKKVLDTGECDILILDEILALVELNIISEDELVNIIQSKQDNVELILTGRYLPKTLTKYADYISTIESTKHPYDKGIEARKGIEF